MPNEFNACYFYFNKKLTNFYLLTMPYSFYLTPWSIQMLGITFSSLYLDIFNGYWITVCTSLVLFYYDLLIF